MESKPDLLLAGAGLANALVALRIAQQHPRTRILMIEAGRAPGGEHTWSFHGGDLTEAQHQFVAPLVDHCWSGQQVRFPEHHRTLSEPYLSSNTASLNAALAQSSIRIRCNASIRALDATSVTLENGNRIEARAVIDGRGPQTQQGMVLGYQKFVGHEITTAKPHGLRLPVIMDATVDQADGYRFVYLLPFDDHRLLIEDTYYSDGADLSDSELEARINNYAAEQGWQIAQRVREERGVLPILLAVDFDRFWPAAHSVARSGLNAALFHPTTGYSFPQAVALADCVADAWPLSGTELARLTREHAHAFTERTRFFRLLNRMLFRAGRPDQRVRVLQRFYRLNARLITNFYATSLTLANRTRLLTGKPPVPISEALAVYSESAFLKRELLS